MACFSLIEELDLWKSTLICWSDSENEDLSSTCMDWTFFFWAFATLLGIISHLCLNFGNVQIILKENIFRFLLPVLHYLSSPWSKSQDKLHSNCETKLLVGKTRTRIHQIHQGLFSCEDVKPVSSVLCLCSSQPMLQWVAGHTNIRVLISLEQ